MNRDCTETIQLRGGRGRLRLYADLRDVALAHDGAPVALVWADPPADRTVARRWYLRAQALTVLEDGPGPDLADPDMPLSRALEPVLAHLPDGRYHLTAIATPDVSADASSRTGGDVLQWCGLHEVHGDDALLLGTVPRDLLDRDRVRRLSKAILDGARPAVVALAPPDGTADVVFVVAGHTALEAYRRVGMPPVLVTIEPDEVPTLSSSLGARLMTDAFHIAGELARAAWLAERELDAQGLTRA